jgi:ATP-dependent RNA helicase DeaD
LSSETSPFAHFALSPAILEALEQVGYEAPYPIQEKSIPPLLEGRDLLGQAQTGTGKTAAFALPLLTRLDLDLKQPQALVLTPTRELALQVAEAMQTYARRMKGFHVLPVYGGQSIETQLHKLRRGVHAIVGTPGRILDHLRRKTLKLDRLMTVVLDEADEMLRMGFLQDVEEILEHTPAEKQIALFSATMPDAIRRVAMNHLRDPVHVHIRTKTTTVENTSQHYWMVTGLHKLDALTRILEVEDFDAMLVFVRTRTATTELAEKLEARGFSCAALSGEMNQAQREKTVERLRRGRLDILIATDVAARGLDLERISHVINYDIPYDTQAYIHRIGRTGRAGRSGKAILFVTPREKRVLKVIERSTRQEIEPMQLPSRAAIADRRVEQFKKRLGEVLEVEDLSFFEQVVTAFQHESDKEMRRIAAALAFMAQGPKPLQPPEPEVTERPRPKGEKPQRAISERPDKGVEPGKERYRIEVGRDHGVHPKHIVGAIANEADLDGQFIGPIRVHDSYSTVDLPAGMPKGLFRHLRKVWVCGRQLQLSQINSPKKTGQSPGKKKVRSKRR